VTNGTLKHGPDRPAITPTVQDYLLLIYVLERDGEPVVGARLAGMLGVSAPTVTNTLKRMTRDGWITMSRDGTHLTDAGWTAARVVMRRHMLMEWMMSNTLPWSKLHSEAHHLEHAISALTERALLEQFGNPQTCPHGNPLPGCEAAVAAWLPLTEVPAGGGVIVRRIHELAEENHELLGFLESKGLLPGTVIRVSEVLPFNQTITVDREGSPVTLGNAAARYIFVEAAPTASQARADAPADSHAGRARPAAP
jgi:DtxR family Mn-dependent transcriptional regulator